MIKFAFLFVLLALLTPSLALVKENIVRQPAHAVQRLYVKSANPHWARVVTKDYTPLTGRLVSLGGDI